MEFVILCAGKGTRLRPLTETISKVMIPVANKPLLEWTVNAIKGLGKVILVVNKDQKDVIDYFSSRCEIVYQEEPKGTADAIATCEKSVAGKFVVLMGDDYIPKEDIEKFSKLECAAAYFPLDDIKNFGVFTIEDDKITDVEEKPGTGSGNANAGMYVFDEKVFDFIKKTEKSERGEYEITDTLKLMIKSGIEISAFKLSAWQAVAYPWNLLDVNRIILEKNGSLIGKAEIKPGAHIEEPVAIGDGCIIGPNCFIRKFSSIGKNCRVGNAVEIKNSIIMNDSFVSHLSYVGDSVIGNNCNIAAGTIFANLRLDEKTVKMIINGKKTDSYRKKLGSVVGDNVKFGVNVTLMPGRKIWPNLMIPPCITIKDDIEKQPEL